MTCTQPNNTNATRVSFLRRRRRGLAALPIAVGLMTLAGCLGEPEIDERWTLLEFVSVNPQVGTTPPSDQPIDVTVSSRITYRSILTGFLVAEVRYSDTVAPSSVSLNPNLHTAPIASDIDRILANSVTAGRATKVITGWDHLMQSVNLSFTALVPAAMFANGPTPVGGLYLILYVGEGDEIRRQDGTDSLVVTPFVSTDYELLHTGFVLDVAPPGGTP